VLGFSMFVFTPSALSLKTGKPFDRKETYDE